MQFNLITFDSSVKQMNLYEFYDKKDLELQLVCSS